MYPSYCIISANKKDVEHVSRAERVPQQQLDCEVTENSTLCLSSVLLQMFYQHTYIICFCYNDDDPKSFNLPYLLGLILSNLTTSDKYEIDWGSYLGKCFGKMEQCEEVIIVFKKENETN